MASTKFYLDFRYKSRDGRGNLIIMLSHNRSVTSFPTGIKLLPEEWDGTKVVNNPDSRVLNVTLIEKKSNIDKKIALLSLDGCIDTMTASQIRAAITDPDTRPGKKKKHLLSEVFRDYMGTDMRQGTRDIYQSTLDKCIAFAGERMFIEDINLKWLMSFDAFMAQTLVINSRAIYHRHLRAICNYAINTGISFEYPYRRFSIKTEPTMKRSIPVDKLRELYTFEVSQKEERYRDYFFLMFFLIGINAVDLFSAKASNVNAGRLEYIRTKTHKKYSIKIEPEAQALLKKYRGRNYLVDALDRCRHHESFLHEMNDTLGQIGQVSMIETQPADNLFDFPKTELVKTPIISGLTSYWARHTWATIAYSIGVPIDVVSQALGHSFGNKTTLIYVKQDITKVDEANRKVIDYFLNGL